VGRLAEYLIDRYGDDVPIKPKAIIITSETLMPQHKYAIKKAFGIEPINEYGAAEGGIIAFECPEGGLHLSADRVLTEIVNADEEGFGRVVITPFLNRAMPLIRYDIGDIGRIVDDECPCGRTLPLLELKGSRVSDMIKTPRGSFVSSTFFDFVAKSLIPFGLRQFKVIQKSPVNLQIIMLKSDKDKSRIENIVKREIKSFLGDDMQASFEYVDDIEPDKSGKLRYFVREDF
jgi:phenylacetate-CoA ligase